MLSKGGPQRPPRLHRKLLQTGKAEAVHCACQLCSLHESCESMSCQSDLREMLISCKSDAFPGLPNWTCESITLPFVSKNSICFATACFGRNDMLVL